MNRHLSGKTQATQRPVSTTEEEEFLSSEEDEEDTSATAETEVAEYLKSGVAGIDTMNPFPTIKKISINLSLKYDTATPSRAPIERLFSLGSSLSLQGGTGSQIKSLRSFSS